MGEIFNNIRDLESMTDRVRVDLTEKISDDIILMNTIEQIRNLNSNIEKTRVDYISDFNSRVKSITELYVDDQKLNNMIENSKFKFFTQVFEELKNKFNFELSFRDNISISEQEEIINQLYNFFVVNLFENLTEFAVNIIIKSIPNINKRYEDNMNEKDTIFMVLNKKYGRQCAIIIQNMNEIMENLRITSLYEFVKEVTSADPDEYSNIVTGSVFNEEDTYVDLGITPGKPEFLQDNFINNFLLRQVIENRIIDELVGDRNAK